MYHAPVPLDLDQQEIEPAELADESVGNDASSQRLRDAHLHNGQAQTRLLFAPFFALTGVGGALLVAWAMLGTARLELIGAWLAVVAFANWAYYRAAVGEAAAAESRSAEGRPLVRAVGEAVGLAALWSALPTYAFATQPQEAQVVIGAAMGAMIMAAIGLASVPAAAFAWIATMTAALCCAYYLGSSHVDPTFGASIVGVAAVAIFGVARLTRWTFQQLQTIANVRTQSESVRLLLKEYEHRGVGWL